GRILAAEGAVSRRAGEPVVGTGVALAAGRVADRARLDERAAAAARAVGVRDAAQVGVRPAHAGGGLAGAGARAIRVAAAGRPRGIGRDRVDDAAAGGRALVGAVRDRQRRAEQAARVRALQELARAARAIGGRRAGVVVIRPARAAVAAGLGGRGPAQGESR